MALNHLHSSDYNKMPSIEKFSSTMLQMRSIDRRWSDDDSKRFMKGLRVFGKNFFRIRKEFLPEKETKELVEYYYYWKKAPISSAQNRSGGRRQKNRKGSAKTSSIGDNSSESDDIESPESYTCFRCDTESSNQWHYVDQHGFVCESCKLNYRKYGDENGARIPEYLFRPVEPASTYRRPPKKKYREDPSAAASASATPVPEDNDRKSPSESSTCSNTSTNKTPRKRKSPGKGKRTTSMSNSTAATPSTPITPKAEPEDKPELTPTPHAPSESITPTPMEENVKPEPVVKEEPEPVPEKKMKLEQASPDSLTSELNREDNNRDDADDNGNMGDVEQDDNSATTSPHSPGARSDESINVDEDFKPDDSPAIPCNEPPFLKKDCAHFVRCLKRIENSCCRVDVHYVPPPESAMAKKREERRHRKTINIPQPMPMPMPQTPDVKVKHEPSSAVVSDVIRHTSQSYHSMRGSAPPTSMSLPSPHHGMPREHQRMTPTHAHMGPGRQSSSGGHHSSMGQQHGGAPHTPSGHRVTTPSQQRTTPRSQANDHPQFMGHSHSTPALSQLSQLAGRPQQQQQHSIADEMARMAAYSAAASAASSVPTSAAFGMPPGSENALMLQLHSYRMARSMMPLEQIERMYPPEIREKFDIMLKLQEMEAQQKMYMSQASSQIDSKAFFEAQMMDMQRKLGIPPGAMMPPGSMASLQQMGLMPPTSMSSGTSDLMSREKERMHKLGLMGGPGGMLQDAMSSLSSPTAERLSAERLAAERMSAERLSAEQRLSAERLSAEQRLAINNTAHAHTHTHTHLHLHQQAAEAAAAMATQNPFMAHQILQSLGASTDQAALARAAAAAGGMPYGSLPLGFPGGHPLGLNIPTSSAAGSSGAGEMPAHVMAALMAQQRPDIDPRELLAMQQMFSNPAAMAAHQEALHRHLLLQERERQNMSHHMPPH